MNGDLLETIFFFFLIGIYLGTVLTEWCFWAARGESVSTVLGWDFLQATVVLI